MELGAAGLKEQPFRTHGRPIVFVGYHAQQKAFQFLQETYDHLSGLGLLQGPPLSGKSTILHSFREARNEDCEIAIVNDLFVGLTSYDASGQVTPGVAQSWQASPDGLTWRFKLRPNLKWSDGEPLTAADFVFSFRRAVTPATAATMADRLFMLRNAEKILSGQAAPKTLGVAAPAPDEVLLRLEHPAPQLPILLANGIGFPLPRHAVTRWGEQWNQAGRMVSNGAFVLVERRPGERVRLAKNAYFYSADETRLDALRFPHRPSDRRSAQRSSDPHQLRLVTQWRRAGRRFAWPVR